MKKVLLVLVIVSLACGINAQKVLNGLVLNPNNKPVQGVEISIKGSDIKAFTDENGQYNISIPENNKEVVFSKAGFATQSIELTSSARIDLTIHFGDIDYLSFEDLIAYQDYYLANNKKSDM